MQTREGLCLNFKLYVNQNCVSGLLSISAFFQTHLNVCVRFCEHEACCISLYKIKPNKCLWRHALVITSLFKRATQPIRAHVRWANFASVNNIILRKRCLDHIPPLCYVTLSYNGICFKFVCFTPPVSPSWTKRPADQTVVEGVVATLYCTATGHPTPKITWTKDGKVVGNENVLSFTSSRGHAGEYWCSAENGLGKAINASAYLDVQRKNILIWILKSCDKRRRSQPGPR